MGIFAEFRGFKYNDPMEYEHLKWEYRFERQHVARDAAELLPNHQSAQDIQEKLMSYVLNLDHGVGKHKAIVFERALGYNASNAGALERQIRRGLMRYRAESVGHNGYGRKYRTIMRITGPNGKQPVQVGWIILDGESFSRMVTAYVDDKNRRP